MVWYTPPLQCTVVKNSSSNWEMALSSEFCSKYCANMEHYCCSPQICSVYNRKISVFGAVTLNKHVFSSIKCIPSKAAVLWAEHYRSLVSTWLVSTVLHPYHSIYSLSLSSIHLFQKPSNLPNISTHPHNFVPFTPVPQQVPSTFPNLISPQQCMIPPTFFS